MTEHLNQPHIPSNTDYSQPSQAAAPASAPERKGNGATAVMTDGSSLLKTAAPPSQPALEVVQTEERSRPAPKGRRRYTKKPAKLNMDEVLTVIENSPGQTAKPAEVAKAFGVQVSGVSRTLGALADDDRIYRTRTGHWALVGPNGERPNESQPRARKPRKADREETLQKEVARLNLERVRREQETKDLLKELKDRHRIDREYAVNTAVAKIQAEMAADQKGFNDRLVSAAEEARLRMAKEPWRVPPPPELIEPDAPEPVETDSIPTKHHPLVQALLDEIPGTGEPWPLARRAQWSAMAGHVFDYCYAENANDE